MTKKDKENYEKLYKEVTDCIVKLFEKDSTPKYHCDLANVFFQLALKNLIFMGMTKEEFVTNFEFLKNNYDYIYNDYHKLNDDNSVFRNKED